ncbi:MAG: AAC(3) family N-acetyltransferase, partial [Chloroflexota bacterium]
RADFPGKTLAMNGAPIEVDGERQWVKFEEIDYSDDDFSQIGSDFSAKTGDEIQGLIGAAESRLMPQRSLVDYAAGWMEKNRK